MSDLDVDDYKHFFIATYAFSRLTYGNYTLELSGVVVRLCWMTEGCVITVLHTPAMHWVIASTSKICWREHFSGTS